MSNALSIPALLGASTTKQLAERLERAGRERATVLLAAHDAQTLFAVAVDVQDGLPVHWQIRGPMPVELAKLWADALQAEVGVVGSMAAPPTIKRH